MEDKDRHFKSWERNKMWETEEDSPDETHQQILDLLYEHEDQGCILEVLHIYFSDVSSNCYDEDLFETEGVYDALTKVTEWAADRMNSIEGRAEKDAG